MYQFVSTPYGVACAPSLGHHHSHRRPHRTTNIFFLSAHRCCKFFTWHPSGKRVCHCDHNMETVIGKMLSLSTTRPDSPFHRHHCEATATIIRTSTISRTTVGFLPDRDIGGHYCNEYLHNYHCGNSEVSVVGMATTDATKGSLHESHDMDDVGIS
jgi:hypothetical protein